MKIVSMSRIGFRILRSAQDMFKDGSGIAATEFAVIVPIMLVMFFGTVEFSSGVAVDRKVTLISRTLSDLTAQTPSSSSQAQFATATDVSLQNNFTSSIAIIQPYCATPTLAQVSEIYVDSTGAATIQWSKASTISSCAAAQATLSASTRNPGDVVTNLIPAALLVKQTYIIWSEVSYLYKPTIGYVMAPAGVNLSDVAFSRPRQVACVVYNSLPVVTNGNCPST